MDQERAYRALVEVVVVSKGHQIQIIKRLEVPYEKAIEREVEAPEEEKEKERLVPLYKDQLVQDLNHPNGLDQHQVTIANACLQMRVQPMDKVIVKVAHCQENQEQQEGKDDQRR